MKNIKRTILFTSDKVQLEQIDVTVGNCHMKKFREVSRIENELSVKEHKQFPEWYIRELKLQQILDDRD
jgi:hypothetical protein